MSGPDQDSELNLLPSLTIDTPVSIPQRPLARRALYNMAGDNDNDNDNVGEGELRSVCVYSVPSPASIPHFKGPLRSGEFGDAGPDIELFL